LHLYILYLEKIIIRICHHIFLHLWKMHFFNFSNAKHINKINFELCLQICKTWNSFSVGIVLCLTIISAFETILVDNLVDNLIDKWSVHISGKHRDYWVGPPQKPTNMTEASRDPEVADSENVDNGRTALNLTCSTTNKKPLPERGTWSTKLDFILSVVMYSLCYSLCYCRVQLQNTISIKKKKMLWMLDKYIKLQKIIC